MELLEHGRVVSAYARAKPLDHVREVRVAWTTLTTRTTRRSTNLTDGYCIQFEPYQGSGLGSGVTDPDVGLGGLVVLDLISELPRANYQLYFDNFLTSLRLLNKLRDHGIGATETVRHNPVERCPLPAPDKMKKEARATHHYLHDRSSNVIVVRWKDNSVVTVASNCHGVAPLGQAQRWSCADKKKSCNRTATPNIQVQQSYGRNRSYGPKCCPVSHQHAVKEMAVAVLRTLRWCGYAKCLAGIQAVRVTQMDAIRPARIP